MAKSKRGCPPGRQGEDSKERRLRGLISHSFEPSYTCDRSHGQWVLYLDSLYGLVRVFAGTIDGALNFMDRDNTESYGYDQNFRELRRLVRRRLGRSGAEETLVLRLAYRAMKECWEQWRAEYERLNPDDRPVMRDDEPYGEFRLRETLWLKHSEPLSVPPPRDPLKLAAIASAALWDQLKYLRIWRDGGGYATEADLRDPDEEDDRRLMDDLRLLDPDAEPDESE